MIQTVCVYCGSSAGASPAYRIAAAKLGRELAMRGLTLVYGGAQVGLMGELADAALRHGGRVTGVIPQSLVEREVAHPGLSETHVVESMHGRKALMAQLSDAFAALPGGFGTLDELFEILTWALLGFHNKPVILLNEDGYYDELLGFLRKAEQEGFIRRQHAALLRISTSVEELLATIDAWRAS